jgi:hypothetical protein
MTNTDATPGTPNAATTVPVNKLIGTKKPKNPNNKCTPNNRKNENPTRNIKNDRPSKTLDKGFLAIKSIRSTNEHTMITNFMNTSLLHKITIYYYMKLMLLSYSL